MMQRMRMLKKCCFRWRHADGVHRAGWATAKQLVNQPKRGVVNCEVSRDWRFQPRQYLAEARGTSASRNWLSWSTWLIKADIQKHGSDKCLFPWLNKDNQAFKPLLGRSPIFSQPNQSTNSALPTEPSKPWRRDSLPGAALQLLHGAGGVQNPQLKWKPCPELIGSVTVHMENNSGVNCSYTWKKICKVKWNVWGNALPSWNSTWIRHNLQGKRAFCDRGNTNLNHEIRAKAGARVPFGRHLKIDKQTRIKTRKAK